MIFARADTHARRAPMDLVRSVRRTLEMCRRTMDPRIALELTTADEVPSIEGNPGQIEQVLLNICLNARDAMESARTPSPRMAIHIEPARADEVRIRITDNGPGMTDEIRARVFEPFFTTKDVGRGTGLGLAMAYSIIADHRGRIDCETRPGQGATFEINPAGLAGGAARRAPTAAAWCAEARRRCCSSTTTTSVRRALREILTRSGYSVIEATDGANGVAVFEREQLRIDLVVLDRSMPKLSGDGVLERLEALDDGHPGDPAQRPPGLERRRWAIGGGAEQADRPHDAAADGARSAGPRLKTLSAATAAARALRARAGRRPGAPGAAAPSAGSTRSPRRTTPPGSAGPARRRRSCRAPRPGAR